MHIPRSRSGKVRVFVGEGYFNLQLNIEALISLQEALNVGPGVLLDRLRSGSWMVQDIIEPIRLGLIGGGMSHKDAYDLVHRNIRDGYLLEYMPIAVTVVMAALTGVDDDLIEEDDAGEPMAPVTAGA